jgi:hypothetical protein
MAFEPAVLVDGRWTEMIHDEWIRNLTASAPAIPVERLPNTRRLMNAALPMAMVNGYEEQIPLVNLPDPNDFVATFSLIGSARG